MPNVLSYIALLAWPIISVVLYSRLNIVSATFYTIIGGYLLLPVGVELDFSLVPPLSKESICAISAWIGCTFIKRRSIPLIPKTGLERWLIASLLIVPFITTLMNQTPIVTPNRFSSGLTYHDAISAAIQQYIELIPLLVGLYIVKTYADQLQLFKLFLISGLLFSLPVLFEVRMSPQLHNWIYGFFPHSFGQQIRFGGFRPVVFLGHGLLVGIYIALLLGAASMFQKTRQNVTFLGGTLTVGYLLLVLFLCKSVGAVVLGIFLFLCIKYLDPKKQYSVAFYVTLIVLLYPILSIMNVFPHQQLVDFFVLVDAERSESLAFRFYNEGVILEHVKEKIIYGWGGWGRNKVPDSITDGYWIILFGKYGLIGFLSLFGIVLLAIHRARKVGRILKDKNAKIILAGHALIVSIAMTDQIPNDSMNNFLLFLAGALLGRTIYILNIESRGSMKTAIASTKSAHNSAFE